MPYFLEKLDRRTIDTYGDLTQYLRTHPLTIDRISDTRSRANQLGNRGAQTSVDYEYAREKLRVLSPNSGQVQGDGNVQHYAQAVRALKANNGRAALQALGNQNQPTAVDLARAQALNLSGLYAETIALLQPLANAQPNNEAAAILLAEALVADNKVAPAWQVLSRVRLTETTSLEFLEARQRIAEQAGYTADAYISAAERSLRMGEYRHAQAALDQASRLPGTPAATMARLQAVAADIRRTETQAKQLDKQF
jgi:predicted Zn-dependent protease